MVALKRRQPLGQEPTYWISEEAIYGCYEQAASLGRVDTYSAKTCPRSQASDALKQL